MKFKKIAYWVTTIILAAAILPCGLAEILHQKESVQGIIRLGYPVYFLTILGTWKLLGSIALLIPRFPRLKEWAYAGIFFDVTGGFISQAVCGSPVYLLIITGFFVVLTLASWLLRPRSRSIYSNAITAKETV